MSAAQDAISPAEIDEAIAHCRAALETLRGARIFITGGTGFFGRWLLSLLASAGAEFDIAACLLTRNPEAFARACPELAASANITLKRGDVRYFEFPKGRFTHVVHAATDTSAAADADAANLIDTIVGGTRRVLEFAAAAHVERLLYVSSGAVYGPQPTDMEQIGEDYSGAGNPLDPRAAYGQAKRLAEQMCVCAAQAARFAPVIARAFAFVGPGLPRDGHFAIGNFVRDALAGRDVVVNGDGAPLRSYLYASDLAAWLVTLLAQGVAGAAYNVGSDVAISIGELAQRVAALAPAPTRVVIKGAASADGPRARYIPAIARARTLGLDVFTPLDEAIKRTFAAAQAARPAVAPTHRNEQASAGEPLTFVIDVDGVVASLVADNDYAKAEPLTDTIASINRLHEQGHRIVMLTARGSATGLDWRGVTEAQFERWGLRYHELHFGKPAADYYIDDRLMPISALQAMTKR
mgnify:FL=1